MQEIISSKISEIGGYLSGKMLIAMPSNQESTFNKSVILLCVHNENGAMGVIINHHIVDFPMEEIFSQLNIDCSELEQDFPVHYGGPVEAGRGFIIHTDDYNDDETVEIANSICVTSSINALKAIAANKGPRSCVLALGYSGWSSGQLEREIRNNHWLVVDADANLIFNTDNRDKWKQAGNILGFDINSIAAPGNGML